MSKKLSEVLGRFYKSNSIGLKEFHEYCEKIWPLLANDEKKLIYRFLFQSKQWKTYLELAEKDILQTRSLDWPTFLQILMELKLLKNEDQVETYLKLAKSEGSLETFVQNYSLDKIWKKIRDYRKEFIEQKKSNRILLKNNLLQEYQFAKAQRLLNKQKELLEQLSKIFPEDKNIIKEVSEVNLERAKRIIEKRELQSQTADDFELKNFQFLSDDEKQVGKEVKNQIKKIKIKSPKELENIILLMLMIEDKSAVLELITDNYDKLSPWFALDVLLKAEQYLEVISLCDQLQNHVLEPDLQFTIKYNKALALWNLNLREKAIDLMKELVSVRPDYRSSSRLLIEWSGEKE